MPTVPTVNIVRISGFRGVPGAPCTVDVLDPIITAAGTNPDVVNTGTTTNAELQFYLPVSGPANVGVAVESVGALRGVLDPLTVGFVTTMNCNIDGDGGGGQWRWDADSTATDNTGLVVKPTAVDAGDPGRWIRMYEDFLDVRWFGVVAGTVTTQQAAANSAAIQAAINTIPTFAGGEIFIPTNTAISETIVIGTNYVYQDSNGLWQIGGIPKSGLIVRGNNGQGFGYVGASFPPTLKWVGAAGGRMIQMNATLGVTFRNMIISGEEIAAYGMYFEGSVSGWGVSNFEHLVIQGCTKNAVYKTRYEPPELPTGSRGGNDYGRAHWKRCTFRQTHEATGVAMDDAMFVYNKDSGVQDVFDHCEWIYRRAIGGTEIEGTSCLWFEAGTPRVHINDCYSNAWTTIDCRTTGTELPTPKFQIVRHYCESYNFLRLPNANTRQAIYEAVHPRAEGFSIEWLGASGGGAPLVINGGYLFGDIRLNNLAAPVIFDNAPQFEKGWPRTYNATVGSPTYNVSHYIQYPENVVIVGRSTPPQVITTWNAATTYDIDDFAREPGPANDPAKAMPIYKSLQTGNLGNALSDTSKWTATGYTSTGIPTWDSTSIYALDEVVRESGAGATATYKSLQAGNQNHPLNDAAWWSATGNTSIDITPRIFFSFEARGAVNATAFIPRVAPAQVSISQSADTLLATGSVFPVTLNFNKTFNAPQILDPFGRDAGRKIRYVITGNATTAYSATFNSVFKFTRGAYAHSGPAKTDILEFVYDATNACWWETSRSVGMTAANTALVVPFVTQIAATQTTSGADQLVETDLLIGNVFPVTLGAATVVSAPTNLASGTQEVGRRIQYRFTGDATTFYQVTFNAIFVLTNGRFFPSGPGKTDSIEFIYDGTNWVETWRSTGLYPKQVATLNGGTIIAYLDQGSVFPVQLTVNSTVIAAPQNYDSGGRDVGRSITFRIKGDATSAYAVAFSGTAFKLAGGAYTHSGINKTDILTFIWDGTYWWEQSRSMNMS